MSISKTKLTLFSVSLALLALSGAAKAALLDRGGGLLYDDVLNVTWLQDANYAVTSGYSPSGQLTLQDATNFTNNLIYHDAIRNVDYSDWRSPISRPSDGIAWNLNFASDGSTDAGYYINGNRSELGQMFYVNLGFKGFLSPTGEFQPDFGIMRDGTLGDNVNVGLVKNLYSKTYWTGTSLQVDGHPNTMTFSYYLGSQSPELNNSSINYVWAVRDGDVIAAVPEPETYLLMISGLGMLGAIARKRKRLTTLK